MELSEKEAIVEKIYAEWESHSGAKSVLDDVLIRCPALSNHLFMFVLVVLRIEYYASDEQIRAYGNIFNSEEQRTLTTFTVRSVIEAVFNTQEQKRRLRTSFVKKKKKK